LTGCSRFTCRRGWVIRRCEARGSMALVARLNGRASCSSSRGSRHPLAMDISVVTVLVIVLLVLLVLLVARRL
jgi:hypothetical protein